jgi:hypothetical protein
MSDLPQLPNALVMCFEDNDLIGGKSVQWNDAISFLVDPIYGYQLESKVTTEP